nr:hypothetical protein P5644_11505 [Bacillus velezensis]
MQENNNNPYVPGPVKEWKMTPEELAKICRKTSNHIPRGTKAVSGIHNERLGESVLRI